MANLLAQNIGSNYKGFLNLDSTINTPLDTTLRSVTDGMGNASPLQLSTTRVSIGTTLFFGGTTNLFPLIKRNGPAIDFKLADDSGFAQVNAIIFQIGGTATQLQVNQLLLGGLNAIQLSTRIYFDGDARGSSFGSAVSMGSGNVAPAASAQLDVSSTTKGFLPPRMTTTQKNAISSPATGLVIFDTTLGKLCVFSTTWQTITSV